MNFAVVFGKQYLINELKWVNEISQAGFLSKLVKVDIGINGKCCNSVQMKNIVFNETEFQ